MRNYAFSREEWNELFTRLLLEREEVMLSKLLERVRSTVLVSDMGDKFCWAHDRNGEFWVDGFEDFYSLCNNMKMTEIRKSFWLISISAACWTIWLARNGMVFERRMMTMENLIFQSKMRTLLWIIFVYDELMLQENFWWICPNRCRIDLIKFQTSCIDMTPSSAWMLKVQCLCDCK
ncbi:hypothetical protein Gotur_007279 [Gossypium turneri]